MAKKKAEVEAVEVEAASPEDAALAAGIEKAALYQEEHDSRPDDDPLKMAEDAVSAAAEAAEEPAAEEYEDE